MIKKGKKTLRWETARARLKNVYAYAEITSCELRLNGCLVNNYLSFAHRYKRNDPRCEHTFQGTLLVCQNCHQKIEYDRKLTEEVFKKLR